MSRILIHIALFGGWILAIGRPAWADEPVTRLNLDEATRTRCVSVLRAVLESTDFWSGLHAAEALSLEGFGTEVRGSLAPRLEAETDAKRRCGLARELVRAGDLSFARIMFEILASPDPYAHILACESAFKVWQIGDGELLRKARARVDQPILALMAAAALARWGDRDALALPRKFVHDENGGPAH